MAQRGLQVVQMAEETGVRANHISATLTRIYVKLGFKSRMEQLREYQFGEVKRPSVENVKRTSVKAIDSKELIIKLRHRDGDGCFFCGNPVDFSPGGKLLENGPSMHIVKPGMKKGPIPDDNRKLAHRSCNPIVKLKDARQARYDQQKKYRSERKESLVVQ